MIHKYILGKTRGNTLLVLHGTGGDENDLIPLALEIAPGFSILSVRGNVRENGMNRYFRRFSAGVFDLEDLVFRTNELADFVENAKRDYDLGKIYALGYSNGANIAAGILLLRPAVLAGAVLLRTTLPIEPARIPDLGGKPVFVSSGEKDEMVPIDGARKLSSVLIKAGADVTHNWENVGHRLTAGEIPKIKRWMKKLK
jgi:predicted esterase